MGKAPVPGEQEKDIEITDQEFENESRMNVERWISAHIIPVCIRGACLPTTFSLYSTPLLQEPSIAFSSPRYPTLLPTRFITVKQIDGDPATPMWSRVLLDDSVRIIGTKQVLYTHPLSLSAAFCSTAVVWICRPQTECCTLSTAPSELTERNFSHVLMS